MSTAVHSRLLASTGSDGSLVAFDLVDHRVVSRAAAHRGVALSAAWGSDVLLSSGSDGAVKWWSLAAGGLQLRGQVQEDAPVRFVRVISDGWVYSVNGSSLVIARAGRAVVRLELTTPVRSLAVSADLRYVVASLSGEAVVLDVRADRLAALAIASDSDPTLGFLDRSTLAVVSAAGFAVVALDGLAYERF